MKTVFYLLLTILSAYCCGNLNGAIIVSTSVYHSDVREKGSGNAGLTNFYRNYGARMAVLVILIDIGKAIVAVNTGCVIMESCGLPMIGRGAALLAVMLGHMFPLVYRFRGGKGVLTTFSGVMLIDWRIALMLFAAFIIIVMLTRYVSLGSVLAALLFPVALYLGKQDLIMTAFAAACGLLITIMHRDNIRRLLQGKESKLTLHRKSGRE